MAFPSEWIRKVRLIIPASGVSGSQSNFPVMLVWNGTSGNLPSEVYNAGISSPKSDGSDIRFTSDEAGTTELSFEIVTFSPNATVSSARVKIWVKLTSLSSSAQNNFYMWWGNSSASAYGVTDTYGRNSVWSNSYLGVYHLDESSGSTATNSVGSNDGTYTGTSFPNRVDTSYGYMQNFVNSNSNYVSLGTGSPWTITGNITVSAVLTVSSFTDDWQAIIAKGDNTYRLARESSNNTPAFDRTTSGGTISAVNGTAINTGYHHVAGTFGTSTGSYCYVDGSAGTLDSDTSVTSSTAADLCIGRNSDNTDRDWNGYLGEVRISNTERSSTWIATEYNTLLNFSTFVIYGNVVSASINVFPFCGWTRKCLLTQNYTETTETTSDFPVPLIWNGTSGNLPAEVYNSSSTSPMPDGRDIRFSYDPAGNQQIPLEIVTFSPNSTVASARVEIWISLDISSTTDTTFYIWWGNPQAIAYEETDPYGRDAVWAPSNFYGVYHMDGSGDAVDSTGNGITLTNSGTASSSTALGTARDFVASERDYLYYNGSFGTPTAITFSALVDVDSIESNGGSFVTEGDYTGLVVNNSSYPYGFYYQGSSTWLGGQVTTNIVGAGLQHVAYVCDPSSTIQRIILNGTTEVDTTGSTAIDYTGLGSYLMLGRHANGDVNRDLDGRMDEVWISHQARSAGWVANEYSSKIGFASFITAGTAEDVEGIKIDNTTSYTSTSDSFSYDHTIGDGINRLLIVNLAIEVTAAITVSSITYNGVAMTSVDDVYVESASVGLYLYTFQMLEDELPGGGTYSVSVTLSDTPASGTISGAMSFWNVDQRGYTGTSTNTVLTTDTINTSITPTAYKSIIISSVGAGDEGSFTASSPLIERYDVGAYSFTGSGATMHDVNPVSTTVTETFSASANRMAIIVMAYLPIIYRKHGIFELGINF